MQRFTILRIGIALAVAGGTVAGLSALAAEIPAASVRFSNVYSGERDLYYHTTRPQPKTPHKFRKEQGSAYSLSLPPNLVVEKPFDNPEPVEPAPTAGSVRHADPETYGGPGAYFTDSGSLVIRRPGSVSETEPEPPAYPPKVESLSETGPQPVGSIHFKPPPEHRTVSLEDTTYFYKDGDYYVRKYSGDRMVYVVVEPPLGAVVYELPERYKKQQIGDRIYFVDGDSYYMRGYTNDRVAYRVTEKPTA
jgi:hypothetical protein